MAAARQAVDQARVIAKQIVDPWQRDATASLARVALAERDPVASVQEVDALMDHLARGGTWEGDARHTIEPTCKQVLAFADDRRAAQWLTRAHDGLQAHEMVISDPALRLGFFAKYSDASGDRGGVGGSAERGAERR